MPARSFIAAIRLSFLSTPSVLPLLLRLAQFLLSIARPMGSCGQVPCHAGCQQLELSASSNSDSSESVSFC